MSPKSSTCVILRATIASISICLLASCSCDPRGGGIFWDEACAAERLRMIVSKKASMETKSKALQRDVSQLRATKRREQSKLTTTSSVRTFSALTSPQKSIPDEQLREKEAEVRKLEQEIEQLEQKYGALIM